MGLKIETVPLGSLKPLKRNRRKHGERNLAEIEASLLAHGQVEPLLIRRETREIVAGNGRFAVMCRMGLKTADVVFLDVDESTASKLAIRLNRAGELAEWDDALRDEIERLAEEGVAIAELGFLPDEVAAEPAVDESGVELVEHSTLPPPETAWVLIGIPTIRYGEIDAAVRGVASIPGVVCETSASGKR